MKHKGRKVAWDGDPEEAEGPRGVPRSRSQRRRHRAGVKRAGKSVLTTTHPRARSRASAEDSEGQAEHEELPPYPWSAASLNKQTLLVTNFSKNPTPERLLEWFNKWKVDARAIEAEESRLIGKLEVARTQVFRVVSQIKAVTSEHRHHVQMMRTIAGQFGAAVNAANRLREEFQGEYREAYEEEAARLLQRQEKGEVEVGACKRHWRRPNLVLLTQSLSCRPFSPRPEQAEGQEARRCDLEKPDKAHCASVR